MPSFNIHIAIASEYIKYHPGEIKNQEEFMRGTIAPDLSENKYKSHFDNYAERHNGLSEFLDQNQIDITSDYGKGYFLHLVTDELFYHKVFEKEHDEVNKLNTTFHHDWDCRNKLIINEYKIEGYMNRILEEKTQFLDFEKVKKFINQLSKITIEEQIHEIKNNGNPII